MPGNATPLIEALLEVIDAAWLYLLGEIHKDVSSPAPRGDRQSAVSPRSRRHGYPVTAVE